MTICLQQVFSEMPPNCISHRVREIDLKITCSNDRGIIQYQGEERGAKIMESPRQNTFISYPENTFAIKKENLFFNVFSNF